MNNTILSFLEKCQHLQREAKKVSLTIAHYPEDGGGFRLTIEIYRPRYDRWYFIFSASQTYEENRKVYEHFLNVYTRYE